MLSRVSCALAQLVSMVYSACMNGACIGESVSVLKHTDAIPDPRAVNQDKKNILFSVSSSSFDYFLA